MNAKAYEAIIHSIFRRDGNTHNPTAGTTAVVSIAAAAKVRYTVDSILVSQRNLTAAAYTATLTLRDASIAGTVLAQWDFITAVNTVDRYSERIGLPGLINSAIFAVWNPPAASVTQNVAMVTYRESFS